MKNKYLYLNIIDTPGFDEQVTSHGTFERRSDEAIVELISDFLCFDVTSLNVIYYCIDSNRSLNKEDILSLNLVSKQFGDHVPIKLVFTHTEIWSPKKKKETWVNELSQLEIFNENTRFLDDVLFSGCITSDYLHTIDESATEKICKNIIRMRHKLILDIFGHDLSHDFRTLGIFHEKYELVVKNFYKFNSIFNDFLQRKHKTLRKANKIIDILETKIFIMTKDERTAVTGLKLILSDESLVRYGFFEDTVADDFKVTYRVIRDVFSKHSNGVPKYN